MKIFKFFKVGTLWVRAGNFQFLYFKSNDSVEVCLSKAGKRFMIEFPEFYIFLPLPSLRLFLSLSLLFLAPQKTFEVRKIGNFWRICFWVVYFGLNFFSRSGKGVCIEEGGWEEGNSTKIFLLLCLHQTTKEMLFIWLLFPFPVFWLLILTLVSFGSFQSLL